MKLSRFSLVLSRKETVARCVATSFIKFLRNHNRPSFDNWKKNRLIQSSKHLNEP